MTVPIAAATHAGAPASTATAAMTSTSAGMASAAANRRRARAVNTSGLVCGRRRSEPAPASHPGDHRDLQHEHAGGGRRGEHQPATRHPLEQRSIDPSASRRCTQTRRRAAS